MKGAKIPTNQIQPWSPAMTELPRLQNNDICNFLTEITEDTFQIVALNVVSLAKHFKYDKADQDMKGTKVIMLQKTFLTDLVFQSNNYYLGPQYRSKFINLSKRKGIVAYYPNTFKTGEYCNRGYQMITIESYIVAITNIYRAKQTTATFNLDLKNT